MPPTELYTARETTPARHAVAHLARHLPEPIVLAGGWGVWATVTQRFQAEHGTPYIGSRDADFGFTVNPAWTLRELRASTYAKALAKIEQLGYHPSGTTRYCRWIHYQTGRDLTESDARRVPTHDLIQLFVDPMVDAIHPRHTEVFKIKPLDAPLLRPVFSSPEHRTESDLFGTNVWIPDPSTLLAMKFASFPERNKDDKAVKDLCDAYAVAWYGPAKFQDVTRQTRKRFPEECSKARAMVESPFLEMSAQHLGIAKGTIARALNALHK